MAERYSKQHGISAISFRPSSVLGHGRLTGPSAEWFSGTVSLPAVGKPIVLNVQETARFSVTYVEDVAELIRILLEVPSPKHSVYNTGGYTITMAELADEVRKFIPDAQIEFGREPWSIAMPWKVSAARAKQDLGFSPRPFREAVSAHINHAREEYGLKPL